MKEGLTRGGFIKGIFAFFAAIWAGVTTYPVFRYLISGAKLSQGDDDTQLTSLSLGPVDNFIPGSSKNFKFGSIPALLVRNESGSFRAYNATCTHLSCTVQYSNEEKKIWKLEETTEEWKKENLHIIKQRLTGWQLESFEESYTYKIENGISLFKKNLKNE